MNPTSRRTRNSLQQQQQPTPLQQQRHPHQQQQQQQRQPPQRQPQQQQRQAASKYAPASRSSMAGQYSADMADVSYENYSEPEQYGRSKSVPIEQEQEQIPRKIPITYAINVLATRLHEIEDLVKNGGMDGVEGGTADEFDSVYSRLDALDQKLGDDAEAENQKKDVILLKNQIKMIEQSCKSTKESVIETNAKFEKRLQAFSNEITDLKALTIANQSQIIAAAESIETIRGADTFKVVETATTSI